MLAEWIMMGLFFIMACALYLVAAEVKRLRDSQAEMRDELMLLRVAQMHEGNIVFQAPHLLVVNDPATGEQMKIHCLNGNLTYAKKDSEQ